MTTQQVHGQDVTAVLVTCGDSPYLSATLRAIGKQTRLPQRLVIVDVAAAGRDCGTGHPLNGVAEAALDTSRLPTRVVSAAEAENFGTAVRIGISENAEAEQRLARRHEARTGEIPLITPDDVAWLWLLHDDSAPESHALEELLKQVELATSVALAGCKQRGWAKPDRLLEVGINATSTTRRFIETDVDEIDQGQFDHRSDVFGVGIAGALIRRDVWAELDGTDPALGPYNDGLEFSRRVRLAGYRVIVVPTAIVFHAQASYQGVRSDDEARLPDVRRSFGARRRAQLHTWISGVPTWQVPFVYLFIAVLAPLRALWRLACKDFDLLNAELQAAAQIIGKPGAWLSTRRRTSQIQKVPRATLDRVYTRRSEISAKKRELRRSARDARRAARAPSELEIAELTKLSHRRRWVLGLTTVVLLVAGIWAVRPPLQVGTFEGGSLLRASGSFAETYRAATSGWIDVGLGHPGPPDTFLLALLPALVLTGNLTTLVPLAYWLAVPVAGIGAWFAAGAGTRSTLVRAWAALTWALAPAFVPALHAGQLGGALAHAALPWMILGLVRAVAAERHDVIESGMVGAKRVDPRIAEARRGEYRGAPESASTAVEGPPGDSKESLTTAAEAETDLHEEQPSPDAPAATAPLAPRPRKTNIAAAAGASIAFAFVTAGAPTLLLPMIAVLWIAQLFIRHHRLAYLLVPVPALVLHIPRLYAIIRDGLWELAFSAPGEPIGISTGNLLDAALGFFAPTPDGAVGPVALSIVALSGGAIVVFGAIVALFRRGSAAIAVRIGWLTAVIALGVIAAARGIVVAVMDGEAVTAATGPLVSLLLAGLLVACIAASDGVGHALAQHSFGWRHAVVAIATVAAYLVPLAWALTWTLTAPHTMQVRATTSPPTPALAQQLADGVGRERTLIAYPEPEGALRADIVRTDGLTMLSSSSVLAVRALHEVEDPAGESVRGTIAELSSGGGENAATELGAAGVGVIVVPPHGVLDDAVPMQEHTDLIAAIDAAPGLSRVTVNESGTIWRVNASEEGGTETAQARIIDPDGSQKPVASDDTGTHTQIPAGEDGRILALAERADDGWTASLDRVELKANNTHGQQRFELPANAGDLDVSYHAPYEPWWKILGIATLFFTALLAIPRRRFEVDQ